MRIPFFPVKDATIYEEHPTRNAGLDEILEVGKTNGGQYRTRSLLGFDIPVISNAIATGIISSGSVFELQLNIANAVDLHLNQTIEAFAISGSWTEGAGYYYQDIIQANNGVTWNSSASGSTWAVTGSARFSDVASVTSSLPIVDFKIDVTTLVRSMISGTLDSTGFCLMFDTGSENDLTNKGNLKLFSKDSHTIYRPTLTAMWNDQVYSTGSLSASPSQSLEVIPSTLKPYYSENDLVRVDLAVRSRYPLKTFDTRFTNYSGNRYLPSASYYSIVDDLSGQVIVPFDDYSRVSTDAAGSYISFKVAGMFPRRFYRLRIKVIHDGLTEIFDDRFMFGIR